jgi:nicotinamide-nucleotide amidase
MSSEKINATIITIGDELLIGQTIDTNSAWMGQQLNKAGIWVHRRVAVGDVWNDIWQALDDESKQANIILITGGLGPTADDITKPLLCEYFGGKLVLDEGALQNVKFIFEQYLKRPLIERNLKQAEVPDVCTVIQNKRGTAPGMWFEKDRKIFVSMPGVPHEMKGMMTDFVIPKLVSSFTLPAVVHRTLVTAGIGESFLAERIQLFEQALPAHIKLAYLPNYGMVRLRLTATGTDKQTITSEVEEQFTTLQSQLQDVMIANEDEILAESIGKLLLQKGKTVGTAESCTGGYIAHQLTSIAGSSAYFVGSVVSYSNDVKQRVLGVQEATLQQFGAVSEQTVNEMATGALQVLQTDYAIAVSGIMGPGGGTDDKPVGTVWIAVAGKNTIATKKFQFRFDRERNMDMTAMNALLMLRQLVLEDNKD